MHASLFYRVFKTVGYVVLALGVVAILYATYISISNWHGIGV
ncbi:MAG TPA: hypothetical protein VK062_04780 [Burkholderiaceae bacterium]|nr:hypothetical protein [Burkholderiaceae bacterium]